MKTSYLLENYTKNSPYNSMYVNLYVLKFNEYYRQSKFNDAITVSQTIRYCR